MRFLYISILLCLFPLLGHTQLPENAPLPEQLSGLAQTLLVNHFPNIVHPTPGKEKDPFDWYWKHNTAVMAPYDVQVIEAGAFLLNQGKWTQRVKFNTKEFARLFSCPKGYMLRDQPYTFENNWRTGNQVSKGWAAWYFIGTNPNGKKIFGWGPVFTSDEIK